MRGAFFHVDGQVSALDRAGTRLLEATFGTLSLLTQQQYESQIWFIIVSLIRFVQMTSLVVLDDPGLPWGSSPIALGFGRVASYLAPAAAAAGTDYFIALLAIFLAWTVVVCSLAIFIGASFMLDWPQNGLILRTFRFMGNLTATILFLPITGVLFRGMRCSTQDGGWLGIAVACDSAGRILATVIIGIFLVFVSGKFAPYSPRARRARAIHPQRVEEGNACNLPS